MDELYFTLYKLILCDQCLLHNIFECEHRDSDGKNFQFIILVPKIRLSSGRPAFLVISIGTVEMSV